jgi:hypothetical protein
VDVSCVTLGFTSCVLPISLPLEKQLILRIHKQLSTSMADLTVCAPQLITLEQVWGKTVFFPIERFHQRGCHLGGVSRAGTSLLEDSNNVKSALKAIECGSAQAKSRARVCCDIACALLEGGSKLGVYKQPPLLPMCIATTYKTANYLQN